MIVEETPAHVTVWITNPYPCIAAHRAETDDGVGDGDPDLSQKQESLDH